MLGRGCGESKAIVSPTILLATRHLGTTKVRRVVRVAGVSPDIGIVPFNHKFSTLERAVKERVFTVKNEQGDLVPPPRPTDEHFRRIFGGFSASLAKFLPKTAPYNYQQFVDTYKGRKKEVYQRVLHDMRSGRMSVEESAHVEVFIKNEKTDRTSKADPVPRVISPRRPQFNLRVGRFIKKIEHKVFASIGKLFEHPTVIKGYNYMKSASLLKEKWDMFEKPVAVGLDASRFDQHVSKVALEMEHEVYLKCFASKKDRSKLAALLKHQLVNRCIGYAKDGMLKYKVEGTRMSGDMNTSLGNCVLMCGMIWAYLKDRGIKGSLANNGDDCVVFMEQRDLQKFSKGLGGWFLDMGFNMQVEKPVYEFEHVEFCQTKPIFDGVDWTMCRNPRTAIAKDSVMMHEWAGPKLFKGWLDAVGVGGLSMTGGLPVFQSFYRMYCRSGERRKIPVELISWNMQQEMKNGSVRKVAKITPEARSSFYSAFGCTPDEQIELERYYDTFNISTTVGEYFSRGVLPDL